MRWCDGRGWATSKEPWIISKEGREVLRTMVEHENQLRNQRLGYLLALNGFLFAALAFAWRAPHALALVVVLAALGILIAGGAYSSMILSDGAIRYLRSRGPTEEERSLRHGFTVEPAMEPASIPVALSGTQLREGRKAAKSSQTTIQRISQPWHSLPVILGAAWLVILILGSILL